MRMLPSLFKMATVLLPLEMSMPTANIKTSLENRFDWVQLFKVQTYSLVKRVSTKAAQLA
jgi:hypothetical protein